MGEAGNGEGGKRRLPLWMSKDVNSVKEDAKLEKDDSLMENAGCVLRKCQSRGKRKYNQSQEGLRCNDGDDDNGGDLQELQKVDAFISRKRKTNKKKLKSDEPVKEEELKRTSTDEEGCILRKCQSRRKRECNRSDRKIDGDGDGSVDLWESGEVVYKPVNQKKKINKKKLKYDESMKSEGPSDDEEDLTVEDLLSIAQEYVSASSSVEQAQSSTQESGLGSQLPPVALYKSESNSSLDVHHKNVRLDACEALTSACDSSENTKYNISVNNMKRTGDPAQDMLDLFLGPLLKKPIREETKTVHTQDLTHSYESERKTHSGLVSGELSPLTKKKSSLKEQVAMFLD